MRPNHLSFTRCGFSVVFTRTSSNVRQDGGGALPGALGPHPVETIERGEFKATKARREAVARGRGLLSQLVRSTTTVTASSSRVGIVSL